MYILFIIWYAVRDTWGEVLEDDPQDPPGADIDVSFLDLA